MSHLKTFFCHLQNILEENTESFQSLCEFCGWRA